jgi:LacI family transcriptional regulator
MQRLLSLKVPPDAVYCYNDPMAVSATGAILKARLRIPEEIAVVDTGNVRFSDMLRVPLTTIEQGSRLIGEQAANLLIEQMKNRGNSQRKAVTLPVELIVRESS